MVRNGELVTSKVSLVILDLGEVSLDLSVQKSMKILLLRLRTTSLNIFLMSADMAIGLFLNRIIKSGIAGYLQRPGKRQSFRKCSKELLAYASYTM